MRLKNSQKPIVMYEVEDVFSIFTHCKKSSFLSESKLYEELKNNILRINVNSSVHLTTHPFIAVHVSLGLKGGLLANQEKIKEAVLLVLEQQMKS